MKPSPAQLSQSRGLLLFSLVSFFDLLFHCLIWFWNVYLKAYKRTPQLNEHHNSKLQISGKSKVWTVKSRNEMHFPQTDKSKRPKQWTRLRSEMHWQMLFYLDFHFYFEAIGTNFFTRLCRPLDPRAIRVLHLRQKLIINLRYTREVNKVTWYLGLLHTYPDIFLIP